MTELQWRKLVRNIYYAVLLIIFTVSLGMFIFDEHYRTVATTLFKVTAPLCLGLLIVPMLIGLTEFLKHNSEEIRKLESEEIQ